MPFSFTDPVKSIAKQSNGSRLIPIWEPIFIMEKNLNQYFQQKRDQIFTLNCRTSDSMEVVHAFARVADDILRQLFNAHDAKYHFGNDLAMVAVGGFGRGELCPYSDIDVMLLYTKKCSREGMESLVRTLWDTGLNIGCVTRTLSECIQILGDDLATDTSLLECVCIAGSLKLFHAFIEKAVTPYFSRQKTALLQEMRLAIESGLYSSSDTLYRIEPDIKNGICALRDCQRLIWSERVQSRNFIGNHAIQFSFLGSFESGLFLSAYPFLIKIRNELHIVSQRRMDVLEIAYQSLIAENLGFGRHSPDTLMEAYFKTITDIKRCLLTFIEKAPHRQDLMTRIRMKVSAFPVAPGISTVDGILYLNHKKTPKSHSMVHWILDVFKTAIACHATISTEVRNRIKQMVSELEREDFDTAEVRREFLEILSLPREVGRILQLMHDTEFLEKIIPEFSALRCKVEYDSYHEYTVDQHTLMALCDLDEIIFKNRESVRTIATYKADRLVFRMALLLHDIGKALPGDHARSGAIIAGIICARMGLDEALQEQVQFLVFHHLTLSDASFKREHEENIISDLAKTVSTVKNLDMLYLLTIQDIKHVGSHTWTGWKAVQLKEIHQKVRAVLENPSMHFKKVSQSAALLSTGYIQNILHEEEKKYRDWLSRLKQQELHIHVESFVGFDRITVLAFDKKNFLSDFIGCLASEGLAILSAYVHTTDDGKIVDIFHVESDQTKLISLDERIKNIERKWKSILEGKLTSEKIVTDKMKQYPPKIRRLENREAHIELDNQISSNYTVLEVDLPDCFGLLHRIVSVLSRLSVNIVSARISTLIDVTRDVFYITDGNKNKIVDPGLCEQIRQELMLIAPAGTPQHA
jgi:[protein-PII] uridylyltransferase